MTSLTPIIEKLIPVSTSLEEEIKLLRRIKGILESDKFQDLFRKLSEIEQNTLLELARTRKERALKEHITLLSGRVKSYSMMSVEALRFIAGSQGVQYYSSLQKAELIQELEKNERRGSDCETQGSGQVGGLGRKPAGHVAPTVQ